MSRDVSHALHGFRFHRDRTARAGRHVLRSGSMWGRRGRVQFGAGRRVVVVLGGRQLVQRAGAQRKPPFSKGLSIRGVYTWSRALDDGDSLNGTTANNAPGLVSNPFDIRADWGPATYNATNVAVINAVYALPFGHGQMFASDVSGWGDRLVSGWSINSIVTAQSGLPFTPQLSYNPSRNGDSNCCASGTCVGVWTPYPLRWRFSGAKRSGGAWAADADHLRMRLLSSCWNRWPRPRDKLTADFGTWKTPWGEINRFQRLTGDLVQPFNDAAPSIPVESTSAQYGSLASFGARAYRDEKMVRHQRQQLRRGGRVWG